jgi:hypothetical protein
VTIYALGYEEDGKDHYVVRKPGSSYFVETDDIYQATLFNSKGIVHATASGTSYRFITSKGKQPIKYVLEQQLTIKNKESV